MTTLRSRKIQSGLMSGNPWAVFSIENASVEVERPQRVLQRHGGLGPISHRENLNKLVFHLKNREDYGEKDER